MGRNGHDETTRDGYEAMARLCFSRLRFLPGGLKERLYSQGIWDTATTAWRWRCPASVKLGGVRSMAPA